MLVVHRLVVHCLFGFMPHLPLHRKLLDKLDDADRTFKRARLSKYLRDLSAESLLGPTSDDESDDSEISSISTFSSFSSISSDSDDITDIEEMFIEAAQARVDALREVVHASRVLRRHPPIKKTSQIHLLEHWRNDNLDQYRRKVRVDPNIFDAILDKIRNHSIFHNNSNLPQTPVEVQLAIFFY